jgi:hypothetical protein
VSEAGDATIKLGAAPLDADLDEPTCRGLLRLLAAPPKAAPRLSSAGDALLGPLAAEALAAAALPTAAAAPAAAEPAAAADGAIDPFDADELARRVELALPSLRARGLLEHPHAPPLGKGLGKGDTLRLGLEAWELTAPLGKGQFAAVFCAQQRAGPRARHTDADADANNEGGCEGGGEGGGEAAPLAAKLSSPANLWEWSVHCALRERLAAPARRWMPLALAVHDLARGASSVLLTPVVANPNPNP